MTTEPQDTPEHPAGTDPRPRSTPLGGGGGTARTTLCYRNGDLVDLDRVVTWCRWWTNGDHPLDGVGDDIPDEAALLEQHPELLGTDGAPGPTSEDVPTCKRVEGRVVRYFRPGDEQIHRGCGHTWHEHGWLDPAHGGNGDRVCPGDYIVTDGLGRYRAGTPMPVPEALTSDPLDLDGVDSVDEAVLLALAAVPTCWEYPQAAGVLNLDEMEFIGDQLLGWLRSNRRKIIPKVGDVATGGQFVGTLVQCEQCEGGGVLLRVEGRNTSVNTKTEKDR